MRPVPSVSYDEVAKELPLLVATKPAWAELAAANLPIFLADHAVCEQQVALYALSLAGWSLFGIVFFWQMPHFLAIAWMNRDDYAKAGGALRPVARRLVPR